MTLVASEIKIGGASLSIKTRAYGHAAARGDGKTRDHLLEKLREAASYGASLGLEIHAGHGLGYDTVKPVAAIPEIRELNIGHFLVGEAIFVGLEASIRRMRALMDEARA
jgi:pyridoxine 5-phosphate synthase